MKDAIKKSMELEEKIIDLIIKKMRLDDKSGVFGVSKPWFLLVNLLYS